MLLVWRWNIFRYSFCIHQGFLFLTFLIRKNLGASQNIKATIRWKSTELRRIFTAEGLHLQTFFQQKGNSNPALQLWYCSAFVTWGSDDKQRTLLLQVPWKQQKNQIRNWKFQWCSFLEHKKWNLKQKWNSFLSGLQQGDEHWQCQRCAQDVGKWDPGTWSLQSSGIFVSGTMVLLFFLEEIRSRLNFFDILTSGAQRWPHKVGQGSVVSNALTWKTSIWELRYGTPIMTIWWSIWWLDTFFLDYLFDSVFFRVELHH